jgi:hypothetical protein
MSDRRRYWRCLGCGAVLGLMPRRWCRDCADSVVEEDGSFPVRTQRTRRHDPNPQSIHTCHVTGATS